jgi:hypothetical protein
MNDLTLINKAINNVMNKYITENGYQDHVLFECRIMLMDSSVMFTMMMKSGLAKTDPIKCVLPASFLKLCEEDEVVSLVCDMFTRVIKQIEKSQDKAATKNLGGLTQ